MVLNFLFSCWVVACHSLYKDLCQNDFACGAEELSEQLKTLNFSAIKCVCLLSGSLSCVCIYLHISYTCNLFKGTHLYSLSSCNVSFIFSCRSWLTMRIFLRNCSKKKYDCIKWKYLDRVISHMNKTIQFLC